MTDTRESEITNVWNDCLLKRREDAELIQRFLEGQIRERRTLGQTASFVLNIDASWGDGKTFFLNHFKKHLECSGHRAVYVNAWESDHTPTPLLAVMSAITKEMATDKKKVIDKIKKAAAPVFVAALKGGVKTLASNFIGSEGLEKVGKAAAEASSEAVIDTFFDEHLEAHRAATDSIADFRKHLGELMPAAADQDEQKLLFILVDELDRCRPTYAIEMLETIKHLFTAENVVFVIATDTEQLVNAIPAVYGQNFDARRYLHRFFDRTYKFPEPTGKEFVEKIIPRFESHKDIISLPSNYDLKSFLVLAFQEFELTLRDFEKCCESALSFLSTWPYRVNPQNNNDLRVHFIYLFYLSATNLRSDVSEKAEGKSIFPIIQMTIDSNRYDLSDPKFSRPESSEFNMIKYLRSQERHVPILRSHPKSIMTKYEEILQRAGLFASTTQPLSGA